MKRRRNSKGQAKVSGAGRLKPETALPILNVWRPAPVTEAPSVVLQRWQVYRVDGADHLVGWNATDREGRVSSAIVNFDRRLRRITTGSGRTYSLDGPPGHDPDAEHVFGIWRLAWEVRRVTNVTSEYSSSLKAAKKRSRA
jgi:hypothetical protein